MQHDLEVGTHGAGWRTQHACAAHVGPQGEGGSRSRGANWAGKRGVCRGLLLPPFRARDVGQGRSSPEAHLALSVAEGVALANCAIATAVTRTLLACQR